MTKPNDPNHWHALALAYLDDQLSPAEQQALSVVADDPQFHRCLAEHALDAALLHRLSRQGALPAGVADEEPFAEPAPATVTTTTRHRLLSRLGVAAVAGTMLLAACFSLWLSRGSRPGDAAGTHIGTITQTSGTVTIRGEGGERNAETMLLAGETLATGNVASSAVLRLTDGTRITLAGNTSLQLRPRATGQQVVVDAGQITARVEPQPAASPLWVNTQDAEVQVLGTEFQLSAAEGLTRLDVTEGKVLITQLCDRQSLQVSGGQFAIARDNTSKLTARNIPTVSDTYEVDFEQGLSPGWRSGELVQDGLLAGSLGGVRAALPRVARYGHDDHHAIVSPNAWAEGQFGLFSIHEDSYLNFTYTLGQPGWFHIMIGTRGEGLNVQNFESRKREAWWSMSPGEWRTLSVPLRNFGRNKKEIGAIDFSVNPVGRVAYVLIISSQTHDRQMVIDRLWVSRGLPPESCGPKSNVLTDGSVLTPVSAE